MQTDEFASFGTITCTLGYSFNGFGCVAITQVETKLRIILTRCNEIVRVRVHTRRDSNHQLWRSKSATTQIFKPFNFVKTVNNNVTNTFGDSHLKFVNALVVAMKSAATRWHSPVHRHIKFATRRNVK